MPKRISKEEFDALFGNKRKRDAGGYEDPSREREEWGTSERWRRGNDKARRKENDVPPELLRREKYANSVIENEGEIAPGFQTDAQKAYIAAELLKAHKAGIVKAQASPPPPTDILNAPKPTSATGDPWLDGPSSSPQDYFNIRRSVDRTDPWGGGSVPPNQVPPSSRQPYIHPEDLQLAIRMLNEAQGAQSPTGNRMGMKFSPELLAALLVPSAVVSPLVLDEIGKPKEIYEKALQKTY